MTDKKRGKTGTPVTSPKREYLTEEAKSALLTPVIEASDLEFAKVISIARVRADELNTKLDNEIAAAKLHGEYVALQQQLRDAREELDRDPDIIWLNNRIEDLKIVLFGENRWFNGTFYEKNTNSGENAKEYDALKSLRDEAYFAKLQPIKVAIAAKLQEARDTGALKIIERRLAEKEARRATSNHTR